MPYMEVPEVEGSSKSSKSLNNFSIETHGGLWILHFKKSPCDLVG